MKTKNILLVIFLSAATTSFVLWANGRLLPHNYEAVYDSAKLPVNYAGYSDKSTGSGPADFTAASATSTPAVVHIKTRIRQERDDQYIFVSRHRRKPHVVRSLS